MKPARLLRWYPRAWRERYSEELLALIEDTLDEGQPTWRLRLGLAWGGLRERGHQAWHAAKAVAAKRSTMVSRWLTAVVAGSILANLPQQLKTSPPPARAGQASMALDALAAVAVVACLMVLAGGLAALPAAVRFLRTGGWPKIRRRVVWAAGATGPAAGGLAALFLTLRSQPIGHLNLSLAYSLGLIATALALAVTIGLWASAAAVTARYLKLTPRVRTAELVLGSVTSIALGVAVSTNSFWLSATQASVPWLIVGLGTLGLVSATAPRSIGRAVHRGRRLRARAAASRGR
jgi:hypothetical protein